MNAHTQRIECPPLRPTTSEEAEPDGFEDSRLEIKVMAMIFGAAMIVPVCMLIIHLSEVPQ